MKKLLSIFSIVALTLILVFPADASIDARERPNGASFHIKNVVDESEFRAVQKERTKKLSVGSVPNAAYKISWMPDMRKCGPRNR